MNMREQKGKDIATRLKIERKGDKWEVPSQTGKGKYTVDIDIPLCSGSPVLLAESVALLSAIYFAV